MMKYLCEKHEYSRLQLGVIRSLIKIQGKQKFSIVLLVATLDGRNEAEKMPAQTKFSHIIGENFYFEIPMVLPFERWKAGI